MKCEFSIPTGSGLSVSGNIDGTITLFIKAPVQELYLEMNEETATKVGFALLRMTGGITE